MLWKDAEGNTDWDAYAGERIEIEEALSRGYSSPWSRTYAEWSWDDDGWYPTTDELEPWPSYLRRIIKRLLNLN